MLTKTAPAGGPSAHAARSARDPAAAAARIGLPKFFFIARPLSRLPVAAYDFSINHAVNLQIDGQADRQSRGAEGEFSSFPPALQSSLGARGKGTWRDRGDDPLLLGLESIVLERPAPSA